MKTSKKILITTSVLITALLITSMVVIRNHIQSVFTKTAIENQYKPVLVEKFERLDFSTNLVVIINQGPEYKVELAADDRDQRPVVKTTDGTLYFSMDTIHSKENAGSIKARITTPFLKAIRSVSGTRIHLRNFNSDSLTVDIDDGCVFTGTDNKFEHLSFKSSGGARIELTQTPDF